MILLQNKKPPINGSQFLVPRIILYGVLIVRINTFSEVFLHQKQDVKKQVARNVLIKIQKNWRTEKQAGKLLLGMTRWALGVH